jgi:hypothetical protein
LTFDDAEQPVKNYLDPEDTPAYYQSHRERRLDDLNDAAGRSRENKKNVI